MLRLARKRAVVVCLLCLSALACLYYYTSLDTGSSTLLALEDRPGEEGVKSSTQGERGTLQLYLASKINPKPLRIGIPFDSLTP